MTISAPQTRAARGLLGWSQADLAKAAGVGVSTLADFERGRRLPIGNNLAAIRQALETAGVQFIDRNGGGSGVRLREPEA